MTHSKISFMLAAVFMSLSLAAQTLPDRKEVLNTMEKANDYFMTKYADYSAPIVVGKSRPSNIWTRSVYYEGLMALHQISPKERYYDYAIGWAQFHQWGFRDGNSTRNADNYCASQTYIDLYNVCPSPEKIKNVRINAEMLLNTPQNDDWSWIDAIQMGMPVLGKMGVLENDARYFEKAWQLYSYTRNQQGGGLWNAKDGLWWRDASFCPPYKEPNGEDCYWARGNGWVYAALARYMELTPSLEIHRKAYLADFKTMSKALKACQRKDGFWNVSLHDSTHFGGKETTGTSLFVYGMAWGIRKGILPAGQYLPVVIKAWNAMATEAIHEDGSLGFVQGTGKEPKDGQPVSYDHMPDYEDFGLGCFLLAGSEVYKLP
ncbi:MAG: glycoside hydrolase family 88 protein [Bacteroidota bacterium]|nr:glycoside hydrolase family 88 protein [Bacteroidota bacterium]